MERRPLASREKKVFQRLAARLARAGLTPNAISLSSLVFAAAAAAAFVATARSGGWWWWVAAAACIQLRLLANMLDGMVAVEHGKTSPTGELYNEAPDRFADVAILVGAGYAAGATPLLGFAAAIVALLVAYVRALGASAGAGQAFLGPMAKPHRMFVLTVAVLAEACAPGDPPIVDLALALIVAGGLSTCWRRLRWIARRLEERSCIP